METSVEPPLAPQGQQQDDSNPMLPPNGKPVEITGAPLMGFTMGKLAEGGAGTVADKKLAKKQVLTMANYHVNQAIQKQEFSIFKLR